MVDPLYTRRLRSAQVGLVWAGTCESTVAHLGGLSPAGAAWRLFLDRVRRCDRPLVLQLSDDASLDADKRRELADALGEGSKVAVVARTDRTRGLATALRWLGVEAEHFRPGKFYEASEFLNIDRHKLSAALDGLDAAA